MAMRKQHVVFLAAVIWLPALARAVCLDPMTWVSGYQVPIEEEIKSSLAIVIGRILEEHEVHDDPSDPEYFSATTYKVLVERTLKGNVSKTVVLWTPNDSSRYAMGAGERHILFLTVSRDGDPNHFEANGCGNSSPLPQGNGVVKQVEAAVRSNKSPGRTREG
jgi:hypothetical protein